MAEKRKFKYTFKPKRKKLKRPKKAKIGESDRRLDRWIIVIAVSAAVVVLAYSIINALILGSDGLGTIGSDDVFHMFPALLTANYELVDLDVRYDETVGIVTLTAATGEEAGCKAVVAYVEPHQAESIYRGINKIHIARPNAHDIAVDAFNDFDIDVLLVKVNELKDNAFYGRLVLKKGNKIVSLDARPSDASAIAVRTGAPIYVKSELFETYGESIC